MKAAIDNYIAVRKVATPLRELACHTGSHGVTCQPAEVTFPPLPQPKLVLVGGVGNEFGGNGELGRALRQFGDDVQPGLQGMQGGMQG